DAAPHPALDLHRDRGSADLDDLRVARHLVADEDRAMKGHGGDRPGRGAPLGAPPCNGAARAIHLRQPPTAADLGGRVGVARRAWRWRAAPAPPGVAHWSSRSLASDFHSPSPGWKYSLPSLATPLP